jgi:hypothetical protein
MPFSSKQAASGANITAWSTPQWINELDTALEVRCCDVLSVLPPAS